MTEPERIGQVLFMGLAGNQLGAAERAAIGSEAVGSVWYTELSAAPLPAVASVSAAVQALAPVQQTRTIRLLIGANQEGGQIDQFHGPGFTPIPSALSQGQLAPGDLQAQANGWGKELLAARINLEVAPVMDTVPPGTDATNAPIGALQRGFGHDPATVSSHGLAFIAGMHAAGEAVVVKHFPGLGRVAGNTDFVATAVDDVTAVDDPFLQPFADAIASGTDMVMVSTALYTRIDAQRIAAFSPAVIGLLRNRYNYGGVVVSDDLGAAAAVQSTPPGDRAVDFLLAGGDLVTIKGADLIAPVAAAILGRVQSDSAFKRRVDEAAMRVLELKSRLHLACDG